MEHIVEAAMFEDRDAIMALLPRLAAFEIPNQRAPEELWQGDAEMVQQWVDKERTNMDVWLVRANNSVIGVSIVSYKPELLTNKPSAHLEVLAVDKSAEGQGVATALIQYSEKMAVDKGAQFMSLHVFANNERARALYDRQGFDGELMRYIKPL